MFIYLSIAFVQWMVNNLDRRFERDRFLPTVNID